MRSTTALRLAPVAALILISAIAPAQIKKVGQAYQFRFKYAKGAKTNYLVNSTVTGLGGAGTSGQPSKIALAIPISQTVKEVKGKNATLVFVSGPIQMNGQPFGQGPDTKTVEVDARGKYIGGDKMPSGVQTELPDKPIRIGGTWTSTVPFAGPMGGGGGGNLKSTYKLVGFKNLAGKQVAELAVTAVSDKPNGPSGKGKMFLLVSDGSLFKTDLALQMAMPGAQDSSTPMSIAVNVKRV